MADKVKEGQNDQLPPDSPELKEGEKKARNSYALAFAGVLAVTSAQANELLKQCDFNKNGQIDTAEMYGFKTRAEYKSADQQIKDIITKEKKCETDFSIAQKEASIAQKEASIAQKEASIAKGKEESVRLDREIAKVREENNQLVQILAMLDSKEAKKYLLEEIKKVEAQLKVEKNDNKRKNLSERLEILKYRLKELDKNVA